MVILSWTKMGQRPKKLLSTTNGSHAKNEIIVAMAETFVATIEPFVATAKTFVATAETFVAMAEIIVAKKKTGISNQRVKIFAATIPMTMIKTFIRMEKKVKFLQKGL